MKKASLQSRCCKSSFSVFKAENDVTPSAAQLSNSGQTSLWILRFTLKTLHASTLSNVTELDSAGLSSGLKAAGCIREL